MITKRTFSIASAALVTLGLSLGPASARTHRVAYDDAGKTLHEMQMLASHIEDEADQLVHVSQNPNLSPFSHLERLDAMKADVNAISRDLASLEAERDTLPSWEQQAVDDTLPLLNDAVKNTENALNYFNENRTELWTPVYRGYASKVQDDSTQIAKTLKRDLKRERE